jgi:hypothetical protein
MPGNLLPKRFQALMAAGERHYAASREQKVAVLLARQPGFLMRGVERCTNPNGSHASSLHPELTSPGELKTGPIRHT